MLSGLVSWIVLCWPTCLEYQRFFLLPASRIRYKLVPNTIDCPTVYFKCKMFVTGAGIPCVGPCEICFGCHCSRQRRRRQDTEHCCCGIHAQQRSSCCKGCTWAHCSGGGKAWAGRVQGTLGIHFGGRQGPLFTQK